MGTYFYQKFDIWTRMYICISFMTMLLKETAKWTEFFYLKEMFHFCHESSKYSMLGHIGRHIRNIVIQHRYIKTWRMFHLGNVNVAHANSQQIQSRFVIFDIRICTMEKSLWCCLINASILINTSSALTWKVNLAPRSNHYLHVISDKPLSVKLGIKAAILCEVMEFLHSLVTMWTDGLYNILKKGKQPFRP